VSSRGELQTCHAGIWDLPCEQGAQQDEQRLIDQVAGKLPTWKGRLLKKGLLDPRQLGTIKFAHLSYVGFLSIQVGHLEN
jgi:hypothetical protein